jgi:hypothetical protein
MIFDMDYVLMRCGRALNGSHSLPCRLISKPDKITFGNYSMQSSDESKRKREMERGCSDGNKKKTEISEI